MSLTTRHSSVLIGLPAHVGTASPVLIGEEPTLSNEGWDSLVQIYTMRVATLTAETLAAAFPIGSKLGSRNWWITGSKPQERAPGFWTVAVDYKGWAQTKPALVSVGSSAASQTAENVGIPSFTLGGTTYPAQTVAKLETTQNTPTVTVSYLVANVYAAPKTGLVGTQTGVPISLSVPANIWASLSEYLFHFPFGWVLLESAESRLPGTNAGQITETYQYVQAISPG